MNTNNTINSNFVIDSEILVKYLGSDPTVKIPNGVTKIGTSAFSNSNVEEIVFSRSLQVIEECAFENCKKLEFVKLPEGLIKIGTHAFYGCSALKCVYVPSSILILEENAFSGCPSNFFLISAKGSEAEKFATAKLLGFKEGSSQTVDKFKGLSQKRKELTTKTFDIFGEQITCSNSLPLYDKIVNRYKRSNKKFVDKIKNFLPRDLDSVTNGNIQKIIDDQTAQVLHFLQEEGVVIEKSHATLAISSDVVNLCNNIGLVLKKYKIIKESISKNIEEKVVDLKHEIDSKVTGLPYGVIGNTMDLLVYDIGELEAKARQRGQATAIAERKLSSFQSKQWIQGNEIYDAELKKQMPIICENAENICENLKQWELSVLSKSGLLDMEFIKSLDYKKSMELFNSTEDRERDESIILALSLKKYPYNISAIAKAVAKKYSSQGLLDLVEFLGISNEVAECAKEERAKYISKLKDTLSSKPSTNLMVEFYCEIKGNLDGDEKKYLLSKIAKRISTQVSDLSKNSAKNDIQNTKEYVEQKLISILTPNQWDLFINEGIHPRDFITSIPFENCSTYESMLLYIISTLDRRKKETELKFSRAKEQLESAKTIKEYEETKKLFAKLNGYNDSLKIIEEIEKTILDLQYEEVVSELGESKKREKLNVAKIKLNALGNHNPSKEKLAEVDLLLKKDTKNKIVIGLISSILVIAMFVMLFTVIIPNSKYNDAIALMDIGNYDEAILAFEDLDGYRDSDDKVNECHTAILDIKYNDAIILMNSGKYSDAILVFETLNGYKNSATKINECHNAIWEEKYNTAISLMNEGHIVEAYEILTEINEYKDSKAKAESIYDEYKVKKLGDAKIGDSFIFGKFEQDNNIGNGAEEIEWIILDKKDGAVLVVSKYCLFQHTYEATVGEEYNVTWENSDVRALLNGDFYENTFSLSEKSYVKATNISAEENCLFLLSVDEAKKYFTSSTSRIAIATKYANEGRESATIWWLRSTGGYSYNPSGVSEEGEIRNSGYNHSVKAGVRPAMWIDLNS